MPPINQAVRFLADHSKGLRIQGACSRGHRPLKGCDLLARPERPIIVQGRNWLIAYGSSMLIIGTAGLVWPLENAVRISDRIGWALLVAGAVGFVAGLGARHVKGHCHDAVIGGITFAVGLLILLIPLADRLPLLWILGARFGLAGLVELMTAIFAERERKRLAVLGVLDWIICVVVMIGFAQLNIRFAAVIISCGFLASGIVVVSAITGPVLRRGRRWSAKPLRNWYKPSFASNDTHY